jgi:hypothetical protein
MNGTNKYFAYKLLNTGSMQNKSPARLTFFYYFAYMMSNNNVVDIFRTQPKHNIFYT